MPILNYSTKIDPTKTIGEIHGHLVKHGARKIITDYDEKGMPVALTFNVDLPGGPVHFALPCNWRGVLAAMRKSPEIRAGYCTEAQAQRTAWRIVKDWIEAQMAIIEAGLATLPEVMLPYAIVRDGQTLYQHIQNDRTLLLT